jgi:acetone carboxylase gamma subunit
MFTYEQIRARMKDPQVCPVCGDVYVCPPAEYGTAPDLVCCDCAENEDGVAVETRVHEVVVTRTTTVRIKATVPASVDNGAAWTAIREYARALPTAYWTTCHEGITRVNAD